MLTNCVLLFPSIFAGRDKSYPFLYPAPPTQAPSSMSSSLLTKCPCPIPLPCPRQYPYLPPSQQDGCSERTCLLLGEMDILTLSHFLGRMLRSLSLPHTRTQRVGHIPQKGPSHNAPLYEAATFAPATGTFRGNHLSD